MGCASVSPERGGAIPSCRPRIFIALEMWRRAFATRHWDPAVSGERRQWWIVPNRVSARALATSWLAPRLRDGNHVPSAAGPLSHASPSRGLATPAHDRTTSSLSFVPSHYEYVYVLWPSSTSRVQLNMEAKSSALPPPVRGTTLNFLIPLVPDTIIIPRQGCMARPGRTLSEGW